MGGMFWASVPSMICFSVTTTILEKVISQLLVFPDVSAFVNLCSLRFQVPSGGNPV
jgi:hypothetical protein